ncbi:MFS transporter [Nocardioides aquiterrae]|uniref:MFS transporter n=2 Tax=Nocardioides aquiterrae TaxID=203799 RepID=A0ABN1UAG3_9ACTN
MRLWTAANTVSNAGSWMQMVAQNLLVLELTGSPMMVGLSLSAQAAPGLLLGVLGGAVVDRYPYRLVAGAGQVAMAVIAFVTAALAATGHIGVPALLVLGALSGVVAAADGPAVSLLGNELVPEEDVPSAIAVGSAAMNLGRLGGTALAGAAVSFVGIGAAYVANGLSFLLVAATIPFLRSAPRPAALAEPETSAAGTVPSIADRQGVRAGVRYLLGDRALLTLLLVCLVTTLLGRNYTMSTAALVTGPLGGDAADYGRVSTALAVGGILGALLAGFVRVPRLGLVLALAAVAAGLQTLVGLSPVLTVVVLLAVPMAAAEAALATGTQTMLQTVPPESMRGRVLGAWRTASTSWGLAGPPVLGGLLQLLGARGGLVLGGLASILLLAGVAAVSTRRRRTDDDGEGGEVVPLSHAAPGPARAAA